MTRSEFPGKVKAAAALRANGRCELCTARLASGGYHYDHIVPDGLGGPPTLENCQVLCKACHGAKTAKKDVPAVAKMKRQRAAAVGAKTSSRPMDGSRNSPWKRRMDGRVERRTP